MDSSDWSNGIRYHIFDTRPDTKLQRLQLKYDEPLSNFAFNFNLRRYHEDAAKMAKAGWCKLRR